MMSTRIRVNGKLTLNHVCELLICAFFTWYFLPVCQALLWVGRYKLLFFGCFAIGCAGLMVINGIRMNSVMVAICSYLVVFLMMYIMGIDDAHRHIRISFTFWGTALLYFGLLDIDGQRRIGKYLLLLFMLTVITSSVGVLTDNAAARTIAHAGADDELQFSYKIRNIASITLFQGLVCFVPILICLPKNRIQKLIGVLALSAILFILLNASFTIALIVYAVAVLLSVMCIGRGFNRAVLIISVCAAGILLWMNLSDILLHLSEIIDNYRITTRLTELSMFLSDGELVGDANLRWEQYRVSLLTFLNNPFGVGAYYSYRPHEHGIGYHSKILDDLARYGVFALAFYIVFLTGYYKCLKDAWRRVDCSKIAGIVIIVYVIFLVLNLGFRSAEESILMLFIMPVLPHLIERRGKRSTNT